jgi:hypothetical protein
VWNVVIKPEAYKIGLSFEDEVLRDLIFVGKVEKANGPLL